MNIRYFAGAAEAAGRDEQTIDAALSLGELRNLLANEHGTEFARVFARCAVLVDGGRLADDDPVPQGATVDVLPPFDGG
jgi:molybdopterin converting factor small subunit